MRACALGLLLVFLGAGCTSPYGPFDSGFDVRFILVADPPPEQDIELTAVCTVGSLVRTSRPCSFGPTHPKAREVAVIRAPSGRHRLSLWVPPLRTGARGTVTIAHATWVVLEVGPGPRHGRMRVHTKPPDDAIGTWEPLVAAPR